MYLPRIRALRLQHHMTQKEVAAYLNLSAAGYRKIEKGAVRKLDRLLRLADLYGVSLDYLFQRTDRPHA